MTQLPHILPISDLYRKLFGESLIDVYVVKDEWITDYELSEMITLRLKGTHGINEKIELSTKSNAPKDDWYTVLIFAKDPTTDMKHKEDCSMVWIRRISQSMMGRFPENVKPKVQLFLDDAFHGVRGLKVGEEVGVL